MTWPNPKKLKCLDDDKAKSCLIDVITALNDQEFTGAVECLENDLELREFILAVLSFSPYLRDCMIKHPDVLADILAQGFKSYCSGTISNTRKLGLKFSLEPELMAALRKSKSAIALCCGLADLGGWLSAESITQILSQFADACLVAAFDFMLMGLANKSQFELKAPDQPQLDCGLIVLAMGKHGAFELNYSSDIDLILFYDEVAAKRVSGTDPTTFFARIARQLVKLLQERTSDGYVFRVDLRLRPDPSSTPPIMPLEAGLLYYESYGQNWERAAMIKARAAAGDLAAGNAFLDEVKPFIWRKYLDYAAIQDVHSIKRQIHAHKGHGTIATRGHNIKLGRGGIREIEFFAQTQQLIAGGRIPGLRTLRTIETLQALCDHKWIDQHVVDELTTAYWFLRNVEHRLQMVRDEQTHTMPTDENEYLRIALMCGYKSESEFTRGLRDQLLVVEKHYASLFEASADLTTQTGNLVFAGDNEDPETIATLSEMGYERPSDIMRTIKGWHFGRYPALRTSQARELLTELTPSLLQEFASTGRADDTLIAMDRFVSGLPAGIQLFALLNSNPPLLHLLTLLLSAAPRLSEIITRRPHVFDGLLDPAFTEDIPDKKQLEKRLDKFLSKATDYEMSLNRARIFAAEQKFLIGVRLISGTINAAQAGRAFSDLAQVMVNAMLQLVVDEFENIHGKIEDGEICVLAMGRLGSNELTASSDLDLILLFDHAQNADVSSGSKPLDPAHYFTRLTQRLTAAMSSPTAEGVIYELDFRLRPSGKAGPLATQFGSFARYQREQAWTWEKQALTRARAVAGAGEFCQRVDEELTTLIALPTDSNKLRKDIADMRKRIEKEKGSKNPWDCKSVLGGLIDIEFIAQWLTLESAKLPIAQSRNTRHVILNASNDFIDEKDRETLLIALECYTTVLQLLRTCLDQSFDPKNAPIGLKEIICRAVGVPTIDSVTDQLIDYQARVHMVFKSLIG